MTIGSNARTMLPRHTCTRRHGMAIGVALLVARFTSIITFIDPRLPMTTPHSPTATAISISLAADVYCSRERCIAATLTIVVPRMPGTW